MVPRTNDEILLFLVRNSRPEYRAIVVPKKPPRKRSKRLYDALLNLSGMPRYNCPTKKFEKFLGEPVSFERHLRPLHEEGTLRFQIASPGDYYDSPKYRRAFDASNGQTHDYRRGISYVTFQYRTKENDFLRHHDRLLRAARKLDL